MLCSAFRYLYILEETHWALNTVLRLLLFKLFWQISLSFSNFRLLIYFKCRTGSFKIVYLNLMWSKLCSLDYIFTVVFGSSKTTLEGASARNSSCSFSWIIKTVIPLTDLVLFPVSQATQNFACLLSSLFVFFSKLAIKLSTYEFEVWRWTSCASKTGEGNWARRNTANDLWTTITY